MDGGKWCSGEECSFFLQKREISAKIKFSVADVSFSCTLCVGIFGQIGVITVEFTADSYVKPMPTRRTLGHVIAVKFEYQSCAKLPF